MGNALHQIRRGLAEMKQSVNLSETFSSVQQRKGDRYLKLFIWTFFASMGINSYSHMLQYQIEADYIQYREKVNSKLTV